VNAYRIEQLDCILRYHDLPGADPAFVFLHGLGSASSSYFPRAIAHPRLRGRRAVFVDLIGFGYSDAPIDFDYAMETQASIVVDLLASLAISNCTLVGHSMGGSVATLAAAADPTRIGRLVIAEGNLDPGPGAVSGPVTSMTEEAYIASGHARFVEQIRAAGFLDYAGTLQACHPIALHRSAVSLIASRSPTYREHLACLTMPRTYVYGDRNLPTPDVDRLTADGVLIRVLTGSGHDMMVDNPDGFAEIVAEAAETAA